MVTTTIPPFEATSLEAIPATVDKLRGTFRTSRTKDIQFRLKQLRKLYWGLVDYTPLMEEALIKDLRKGKHEGTVTEINWCKTECIDMINNLEKWAKDEHVVNVPVSFWAMKHRIRFEPYGVVLVIGSFNYPFQLNITPVIGAISAGNTVVLKPSEHSPHSAMVLRKIFEEYLDPECYICVNGDLPQSQALLNQKYDKIVFTGGKAVGTIVAKKAAETLTPVVLELGGQNPAFVTKNADIKLAARRLLWAKCLNAGQVCLSQNYVLVERSVLSKFIGELHASYRVFMPHGAKASPDYCRIVNKPNYDRIKGMLDNTKGKIIMGGSTDESEFFIEPTVVLVEDIEDSMMTQESFGPIFSLVAFDTLDKAIDIANKVDPTPLSLFTFGTDEENNKVLNSVTSGGATINDGYSHAAINQSPIGGVGQSGTGNYHGIYSFKTFSHHRTIAHIPKWMDKLLRVRYMPYRAKDLKQYTMMSGKKPNFDRDGNVTKGLGYWLGLIFGLGSKGAKGAVLRWGVLIAMAISVRLNRN